MTTLADLRLASQQRADRVNAQTVTTAEWNAYCNAEAGQLYATLTRLYEDYNVKTYPFTLKGGDGGNTLKVGFGSSVPDFDKIRHLSANVQPAGSQSTYAPVLRADSVMHFDQLSAPILSTYYGAFVRVYYWLRGNCIEIRPSSNAGLAYLLHYIPSFTKLVNDTDTIDGTWMATNGIDEYIVLGAAAKALVKEESLDTAQLLLQQQAALKAEIVGQFAQRDDNMPRRIVDTKRARDLYGRGWGRWP